MWHIAGGQFQLKINTLSEGLGVIQQNFYKHKFINR